MISQQTVDRLIVWYSANKRKLPWRETRDPYRILVSEVMLQQTQAERVVPKYHEFLQRFPTIQALADAPASEVIRAWSGLGYNRRALNLQRASQAAMERFDGRLPDSVDELLSLPGVGPYTAGAIACFAYERDVAFVDTNIRRVLHRIALGPDVPVPQVTERQILDLARSAVPEGRGYLWNQALMELGATVCRARSTECLLCPVSDLCQSRGKMQPAFAAERLVEKQKAVPFEQTSRYFRGRIVHLLRQAPVEGMTPGELARLIDPDRDVEQPAWTLDYLTGLAKDGLVVSASKRTAAEESVAYDGHDADPEVRFRLPD